VQLLGVQLLGVQLLGVQLLGVQLLGVQRTIHPLLPATASRMIYNNESLYTPTWVPGNHNRILAAAGNINLKSAIINVAALPPTPRFSQRPQAIRGEMSYKA
jgi:hypothetical protein